MTRREENLLNSLQLQIKWPVAKHPPAGPTSKDMCVERFRGVAQDVPYCSEISEYVQHKDQGRPVRSCGMGEPRLD